MGLKQFLTSNWDGFFYSHDVKKPNARENLMNLKGSKNKKSRGHISNLRNTNHESYQNQRYKVIKKNISTVSMVFVSTIKNCKIHNFFANCSNVVRQFSF